MAKNLRLSIANHTESLFLPSLLTRLGSLCFVVASPLFWPIDDDKFLKIGLVLFAVGVIAYMMASLFTLWMDHTVVVSTDTGRNESVPSEPTSPHRQTGEKETPYVLSTPRLIGSFLEYFCLIMGSVTFFVGCILFWPMDGKLRNLPTWGGAFFSLGSFLYMMGSLELIRERSEKFASVLVDEGLRRENSCGDSGMLPVSMSILHVDNNQQKELPPSCAVSHSGSLKAELESLVGSVLFLTASLPYAVEPNLSHNMLALLSIEYLVGSILFLSAAWRSHQHSS